MVSGLTRHTSLSSPTSEFCTFWIMDSTQLETRNKSESSTKSRAYPGMWRFHTNPDACSIYRVPSCLRSVNPEAYTPQLVLIGPLNHSLKSQALNSLGDITKTKSTGYLNMEEHKKIYLTKFKKEFGIDLDTYRRIIKKKEEQIRESYSESTAWIESSEFVEMILHDCVFVLWFILMTSCEHPKKTGDPLIDEPCLEVTVRKDLILLENQLPYFILNELFDTRFSQIYPRCTFRQLIISYFELDGQIDINTNFSHFTDLNRYARTETLKELTRGEYMLIEHMYNADKLATGGVKFEAVENKLSLYVKFENGCLKMPCLKIHDGLEMELRNIMALEQCHYPKEAHVCNYIAFLDHLIDTDKDVDLLLDKGIIKRLIGKYSSVAEMVNNLGVGVVAKGSYYYDIATQVNAHYKNRYQRSRTILKRVYFGNMWIGTATLAAMLLLLMTLIQTVASIIQVVQNPHMN